ncbi:CLUMA_CG013774, isoform A [Clunio marinus]|uniref:CLUMA_CG013774, isoform A n=1 Tax=Clunio marinus TaxID=568069 RepID=A0A1J1IPT4_9DIPT|nr:CLUMA_CG013774, isoform A [Clunio marinus]
MYLMLTRRGCNQLASLRRSFTIDCAETFTEQSILVMLQNLLFSIFVTLSVTVMGHQKILYEQNFSEYALS